MRPAAPGDFDALCDLYEIVFGYRRPEEHDRWKYVDNPAGQRIAIVAEAGSELVGQYALWPMMLDLGGTVLPGAQSLDTMVHPDFRGQGMFTKLAVATFELAASQGVKALYGFPNEASYPGFVRRLNWDHTGDVPRWIRIFRPSELRGLPASLGRAIDAAAKALPEGRLSGHDATVATPEEPDLEKWLSAHRDEPDTCRVARSVEWLRWRYSPDSQREYRWLTVSRAGTAVGAAVWGRRDDGQGVLGDCFGVDEAGIMAAVSAAVRDARSSGVGALHAVTNQPEVVPALRRAGFVARRSGAPLIVRTMTHETLPGNIHDHSAWRIAGGDLDTF